MKHSYRLILDIAGRLVYLAGTGLAIYWLGGGASFGLQSVGVTYLVLWTLWWTVTFLGRQRGESSPYDEPQKWLVIISGIISVPYLIAVPPWEYAHFSGPLPRDGTLAWVGLALFLLGIVLQSVAMWQLRSFYTVRLGVKEEQRTKKLIPWIY
jgi:steroid 5-alpha reductase family enzyme